MGEVIKEIDALFDSYLASFKLFRRLLTLVRHMAFEIRDLRKQLEILEEDFISYKINQELKEESSEPETKKDAPILGFSSHNSIMDKFHEAIVGGESK